MVADDDPKHHHHGSHLGRGDGRRRVLLLFPAALLLLLSAVITYHPVAQETAYHHLHRLAPGSRSTCKESGGVAVPEQTGLDGNTTQVLYRDTRGQLLALPALPQRPEGHKLTVEQLREQPMPKKAAYVTMLTWGSFSPWDAGKGQDLGQGDGVKISVLTWAYNLRLTAAKHDLVLLFFLVDGAEPPPANIKRALEEAFDHVLWLDEAQTRGTMVLPPDDNQRHLWWKLYLFSLVDYERVLWLGSDVFVMHNLDDLMRCVPPCSDPTINGDLVLHRPDLEIFRTIAYTSRDMNAAFPILTKGSDRGFMRAFFGPYAWNIVPENWLVDGEQVDMLPNSPTEYPTRPRAYHPYPHQKPWYQLGQAGPLTPGCIWWWRRALETAYVYGVIEEHRMALSFAITRIGIDELLGGGCWTPPAAEGRAWLEELQASATTPK